MNTSEKILNLINELQQKLGNYKKDPLEKEFEISLYDIKTIIKEEFNTFFLSYQQNVDESIKNFKASISYLINERNQYKIDNRDLDNFTKKFVLRTDYVEKVNDLENKISKLKRSDQALKQIVDSNNLENQKKIEENKNMILNLSNNNNIDNLLINKNNYIGKNEFSEKINEIQKQFNNNINNISQSLVELEQINFNKKNIIGLYEEIKNIKSFNNKISEELYNYRNENNKNLLNNNKSLTELISQCATSAQLNNVKDSISEIKNNFQQINSNNDIKIKETKDYIHSFETKINNINNNYEQKIKDLDKYIQSLETKINNISINNNNINKNLCLNEEDKNTLIKLKNIDLNKLQIINLDNINNLEQMINPLRADNNRLGNEINNVKNNINKFEQIINPLKNYNNRIDNELKNVKDNINNIDQKIYVLNDKINNLNNSWMNNNIQCSYNNPLNNNANNNCQYPHINNNNYYIYNNRNDTAKFIQNNQINRYNNIRGSQLEAMPMSMTNEVINRIGSGLQVKPINQNNIGTVKESSENSSNLNSKNSYQ